MPRRIPFFAYLIDEDEESLILRFHRNEIAVIACRTGGAPCADDGTVPGARSPRRSGRCGQVGSRAAADQRRLVAAARSNPDLGPNARRPVTPWSKSLAKLASPRLELPDCEAWAPNSGALVSPDALIDMVRQLGDRLTVGQRTLTPPVLVRIQVPQPIDTIGLFSVTTRNI